MLYHLLPALDSVFSWLNVFRYITFRAMFAFLFTFLLVILLQPKFIRWMQEIGVKGQPIRDDGPKSHGAKQGTPTMGGLVVVCAILFVSLLLCDLTNGYVWLTFIVLIGLGALGFVDDWRKVRHQSTRGVPGKAKLFWQTGLGIFVGAALLLMDFPTELRFPFFKDLAIQLGIYFVPFAALVIVATSNAVNLTDGLDGLAIGPVMTVAFTYMIFAYLCGHKELADYLALPHLRGMSEISIVLAAALAGGLGFLWYNTFPAQVFMGDVGALALGGLLGFVAVLVKQEIVLIVAGGIFVVEALSVIIQRYSFKWTGKRVFRMAPIHHHFELLGWPEPKIIVRFWIISILLALVSLTTLKLR